MHRLLSPSLALCGLAMPIVLAGQEPPVDTVPASIVGTVVDAESGEVLPGAVVTLEPASTETTSLIAGASGVWHRGLTAVTNVGGRYRFRDLAPGSYRLLVRRLGYRSSALTVTLTRAGPARVSVGLVVQPILLEPERVDAAATLFGPRTPMETDRPGARLDAELHRQRTYPETDVSILTESDLVEAVTLGETDLLRALHRVPGVSTRDDFTAELWTRGATWSHTRTYFDGLPLFNPVHMGGVFSGMSPGAVGSVVFHPGVRSVALGEGAAGAIDAASRPAPSGLSGAAELSVVSARAMLGVGDGRGDGFRLAARRSYVDLVTSLFADSSNRVPYAFLDLAARGDLRVGSSAHLALSTLWEQDRVSGSVRDLLQHSRGHWGNALGSASLTVPLGGWLTTHTLGAVRFDGTIVLDGLRPEGAVTVPVHEPMRNTITYVRAGSRLEPPSGTWSAAWEVTAQRQRYDGPPPRPYPQAILLDSLRLAETLWIPAVWVEARPVLGPVRLVAGLRAEFPGRLMNVGPMALAPRLSGRWEPNARTAFAAGYARSVQYTQTVAPAGPGVGPELHLTDVWLMAGDTVPALLSDVFTVGVERWMGDAWLGTLNVYGRRTRGLTEPVPDTGAVFATRPVFVTGASRSAGFEISLRRLAGRWSLWLAYAFGGARVDASTWRYPSSADRRHELDATAMVRLGPSLKVGGALTVATGSPYTRFILGPVSCDSIVGGCIGTDTIFTARVIEAPNAQRTGRRMTADVLVQWERNVGAVRLGVWFQLRNAFDRRNAVTYLGSYESCPAQGDDVQVGDVCDRFDRGLPLLPLAGVHVAF